MKARKGSPSAHDSLCPMIDFGSGFISRLRRSIAPCIVHWPSNQSLLRSSDEGDTNKDHAYVKLLQPAHRGLRHDIVQNKPMLPSPIPCETESGCQGRSVYASAIPEGRVSPGSNDSRGLGSTIVSLPQTTCNIHTSMDSEQAWAFAMGSVEVQCC